MIFYILDSINSYFHRQLLFGIVDLKYHMLTDFSTPVDMQSIWYATEKGNEFFFFSFDCLKFYFNFFSISFFLTVFRGIWC